MPFLQQLLHEGGLGWKVLLPVGLGKHRPLHLRGRVFEGVGAGVLVVGYPSSLILHLGLVPFHVFCRRGPAEGEEGRVGVGGRLG